jgi:trk system potassium uptake protein TrkA
MEIIVVGGGSVGVAICAQLAKEGHDITVVDSDSQALAEISNSCDIFGVEGNGADISVLRRAGADKADLLLAVASNDEINILCCAAAKKTRY